MGGPRICQEGADPGERVELESITGYWGQSPERGPWESPGGSQEAESFSSIFVQKGPKL